MPLLFVIVVYFETFIIRHFVSGFEQFTISMLQIGKEHFTFNGIGNQDNSIKWTKYIWVQYSLLAPIIIFTGASHFSKSPLLKTFFTVTIVYAGFGFFTYLFSKGIGINGENIKNLILQLPKDSGYIMVFASILLTVFNLALLAMAFFRLKEKEV
jgi:hypothetical protein